MGEGEQKRVVVVDGKEQKVYDDVLSGRRSRDYWYPYRLVFSPDSRHLAYVARLNKKWAVVVDGSEGPAYDDIGPGIVFSPDSQRLAYVAEAEKKRFVVVDSKEEMHFDDLGDGIGYEISVFSPDSKRLVYGGRVGQTWATWTVVVDGKEEQQYDGHNHVGPFIFSPDSRRLAYVVDSRSHNQWFIVVNGKKEEKAYEYHGDGEGHRCIGCVGIPIFSPDSQHMVYVARAGGKSFVVLDGEDQKPYDEISPFSPIVFSPDGKRMAYAARVGPKWLIVLDGSEGKAYDRILPQQIVFSSDSRRLAYVAQVGQQWTVVADGSDKKFYDAVGSPIFSPDGTRIAYIAGVGKKWAWDMLRPYQTIRNGVVVLDGVEQKPYDYIGGLVFTPDSRRLAYAARTNAKTVIVVDGMEGPQYEDVAEFDRGRWIHFDSPDAFHYFAIKDNGIYLVEERIQ